MRLCLGFIVANAAAEEAARMAARARRAVVQLVHVGWKIIEYTVVHATSYFTVLFVGRNGS